MCGALLPHGELGHDGELRVRGLTEARNARMPHRSQPEGQRDYRGAFAELQKSAPGTLHQTQEGRHYFDHSENLTKKRQGYATRPRKTTRVDDLIRGPASTRCMRPPHAGGLREKWGGGGGAPPPPLPPLAGNRRCGCGPEKRTLPAYHPPRWQSAPRRRSPRFFKELINKNNVLVLTGRIVHGQFG